MGNVVSLDSRRVQPAPVPDDSLLRDEPVMLLFDTDEGIQQRLAFYQYEDNVSVTVSSALPASAESMERVGLERLAAMIFLNKRASRHVL